MVSARVLVIFLLASLQTGCGSTTRPPARVPQGANQALLAARAAPCAPEDGRIPEMAAELSAMQGREGYYARAELAAAARLRDALLERVLARHRAVERCTPRASQPDNTRAMPGLMACLLDGLDPLDCSRPLYVVDLRRPPCAMPLATRACDGTGFEGAAACLAFVGVASLLDVVTLPLGTWFWAGPDVRERIELVSFPPAPPLRAEVRSALGRQEQ